MPETNTDVEELPATFTRAQKRDLLEMAEDYKRRKWAIRFLGKVAIWVGSAITAVEAAQTILSKWASK